MRLAKPFQIAGAEFHVEASVGISLFPGDADGAHALLQHADTAMYQSKGRGRAASTVYARMTHDPLERLSLSSRLRRAIANDELELHYQPIVWTASGRLHSMEALLRWNDPERGLVHPDRFLPAAEQMSLLDPIGEWVVGAMARQLREWEASGLRPRMSFNVSPRELHRPDFALELIARLRGEGVDPSRLTMELTESATLREPERIGPLLRELHDAGLQIAIDDFGAGWSSLSRLRPAPGADAQDRPLVPARDPRRPRVGRDRARGDRALGRARDDDRRRGRRGAAPAALPRRAGLPAGAGPAVRRRAAGGRDDRG